MALAEIDFDGGAISRALLWLSTPWRQIGCRFDSYRFVFARQPFEAIGNEIAFFLREVSQSVRIDANIGAKGGNEFVEAAHG